MTRQNDLLSNLGSNPSDDAHNDAPNGTGNDSGRRDALTRRWFALTRETLPDLAKTRSWPISADHCFMRVLLDNACGGKWRDFVKAPAYRNAPLGVLERAVVLGEAVARGEADLRELNARSLAWRGRGEAHSH